jgi:hypothetical protein
MTETAVPVVVGVDRSALRRAGAQPRHGAGLRYRFSRSTWRSDTNGRRPRLWQAGLNGQYRPVMKELAMTADLRSSVVSRRTLLHRTLTLGLVVPVAAVVGCENMRGMPMMGNGSPSADGMPGWMMTDGMMDSTMMADMQVIMDLLTNHELVRRTVQDIDGGIMSQTTSGEPRIAGLISTHVAAMKTRIEQDRPIRHGDPLFREIFRHHGDIRITIEPLSDGVWVTETSPDPQVELLIRQHAHAAVSQFVADGMARAMQPTPLPADYHG